jgi:membrane protein DedA with SNARE-associated domain
LLFLAVAASWAGVPVIGTAGLGVAAVAVGHHTGHDIAILVIGLGAGAIVVVAARRRRRRRKARPLGAAADRAPEDPS